MSGWTSISLWGGSGSGSTPSFDSLVDKVTSDQLPSGSPLDLATSLEICDAIRSGGVTSIAAVKALKKRIGHKNPNVQLLGLNLLDLAVKNGGSGFVEMVSSPDVMDLLAQFARKTTMGERLVREKALELIASWEPAFSHKPELFYTSVIYRQLQAEGAPFPRHQKNQNVLTGAMVETSTAPTWRDGQVCERCRTTFTLTNRKHHCRNCGGCFCQLCCGKQMPLPWFGITQPVRVCETCFAKQAMVTGSAAGGGAGVPINGSTSNQNPTYSLRRASTTSSSASKVPARRSSRRATEEGGHGHGRDGDEDDADLKRALQLSLEESERGSAGRPGFATRDEIQARQRDGSGEAGGRSHSSGGTRSYESPGRSLYPSVPRVKTYDHDHDHVNDPLPRPITHREEPGSSSSTRVDDPDLAAAIAASLQDVKLNTKPGVTAQSIPSAPPIADLSEDDMALMNAFVAHVDGLTQAAPGQGSPDLIRDSRGQALYEQVKSIGGPGGIRMKLIKALDGTSERVNRYEGMHEKLGVVVKMYDGLLDRHLRSPETSRFGQQQRHDYQSAGQGYQQTMPQQHYQPEQYRLQQYQAQQHPAQQYSTQQQPEQYQAHQYQTAGYQQPQHEQYQAHQYQTAGYQQPQHEQQYESQQYQPAQQRQPQPYQAEQYQPQHYQEPYQPQAPYQSPSQQEQARTLPPHQQTHQEAGQPSHHYERSGSVPYQRTMSPTSANGDPSSPSQSIHPYRHVSMPYPQTQAQPEETRQENQKQWSSPSMHQRTKSDSVPVPVPVPGQTSKIAPSPAPAAPRANYLDELAMLPSVPTEAFPSNGLGPGPEPGLRKEEEEAPLIEF